MGIILSWDKIQSADLAFFFQSQLRMRTKLRANEPAAASRAGSARAAQLTVNVFYGFLSHWQTVTCTWRSFVSYSLDNVSFIKKFSLKMRQLLNKARLHLENYRSPYLGSFPLSVIKREVMGHPVPSFLLHYKKSLLLSESSLCFSIVL